jgi:hypothetical protein
MPDIEQQSDVCRPQCRKNIPDRPAFVTHSEEISARDRSRLIPESLAFGASARGRLGSLSGRNMGFGGLGNLPMNYATTVSRAPKPNVLFQTMYPLIVRKYLRQPCGGPNLCPCERATGLPKRASNFVPKSS